MNLQQFRFLQYALLTGLMASVACGIIGSYVTVRRITYIAGAIALARELGPGHTVVTILCDSGSRYQSKLFNPEFLWKRKLPYPHWMAN